MIAVLQRFAGHARVLYFWGHPEICSNTMDVRLPLLNLCHLFNELFLISMAETSLWTTVFKLALQRLHLSPKFENLNKSWIITYNHSGVQVSGPKTANSASVVTKRMGLVSVEIEFL